MQAHQAQGLSYHLPGRRTYQCCRCTASLAVQQVTKGAWSVTRIEGVDPAKQIIYFTGTNPTPLERQLWKIKFDGTGLERITTTPGRHTIDMAPNAQYFIDSYSSTAQPRQVELWSTTTGKLRTMEENGGTKQWLATHEYSPLELFSFTTSDGVKIDASMVKPVPFDPSKKYPVVFTIYGGPGSQGVYNQFDASGWKQQQDAERPPADRGAQAREEEASEEQDGSADRRLPTRRIIRPPDKQHETGQDRPEDRHQHETHTSPARHPVEHSTTTPRDAPSIDGARCAPNAGATTTDSSNAAGKGRWRKPRDPAATALKRQLVAAADRRRGARPR